MKRSFFLNKMLMMCAFLCVVSCTQDNVVSDSVIDESTTKRLRVDKTMEVLIVYIKGTSEVKKRKIRNKYIKLGILLKFDKCLIRGNDNVEVWCIDYPVYLIFKPRPLIEDPQENPLDKVIFNANCKDYNED